MGCSFPALKRWANLNRPLRGRNPNKVSLNLWNLRNLRIDLRQHLLDHAVARLQSLREFLRLAAAAFGHVGFTAATSADNRREFFDVLSCRNLLREIV